MKRYALLLGIFIIFILIIYSLRLPAVNIQSEKPDTFPGLSTRINSPTPSTTTTSSSSLCRLSIATPESGIAGLSLSYAYEPQALIYLDDLGSKWIRVDFPWDLIDNGRTYNWKGYDQFVLAMAKRNIKILATINRVPVSFSSWPTLYDRLARFESALVERYRLGGELARQNGLASYGIRYWEIFNEPNLPGHGWLLSGMDAGKAIENYAQVLELSNRTIHQIDPSAIIVLAGLSPSGYPPVKYWQALYARGLKNCFDVIAFHPYGYGGKFAEVAAAIRIVTTTYQDGAKPIWFNEFGTDNPGKQIETINQFFAEQQTVPAVFWYTLRDDSQSYSYGLRTSTYELKPAYTLFRDLLNKII